MKHSSNFVACTFVARGLAPVGLRSNPKNLQPYSARHTACTEFATAAQPNGGKPPRHSNILAADYGQALRAATRHTRAISRARSRNKRGASAQACSNVIGPLAKAKAASMPCSYSA